MTDSPVGPTAPPEGLCPASADGEHLLGVLADSEPVGPCALCEQDGGPLIIGSLSPSSVADWEKCPLSWRYGRIDKLASGGTPATVRGTLVHSVLERLFDSPAGERTPERVQQLLPVEWDRLKVEDPDAAALTFDSPEAEREWKRDVIRALRTYYELEDPNTREPAEREQSMETVLPNGLRLRGIIDRIDRAPDGRMKVVDYKTGKHPGERFKAKPLFQMKFYALMLYRVKGVLPDRLELMYLRPGHQGRLTYDPTLQDIVDTEQRLLAVWDEIEQAKAAEDFPPRPSKLCDWCDFRDYCPEQGGTLLPYPRPRPDA